LGQYLQLLRRAGYDDGAGARDPEAGVVGVLQPALASDVRVLIRVTRLGCEAAVTEVPDRGAAGMLVAFDDDGAQASPHRLDGVRKTHDAGAGDGDVCVTHAIQGVAGSPTCQYKFSSFSRRFSA